MTEKSTSSDNIESLFARQSTQLAFEPLLAWRADGTLVAWNPACEQLYGYTASEALGRSRFDLLGGALEQIEAARSIVVLTGRWAGEMAARTKDGRHLDVEVRWQTCVDEGMIVESQRDLSPFDRRGHGAQDERQRLLSLLALSADWFWEQDEQFRFTHYSRSIGAGSAADVTAYIGKTRWELPSVEADPKRWSEHRATLERHQPFRNFEYQRREADGGIVWMSVSGEPVFEASGGFRGYRGISRNVTEHKTAEQVLTRTNETLAAEAAERRRQLEAMHDAAVNAIFTIDTHGAINSVNAAATKLFGFTREELVGRNIRMIMPEPYARAHDSYLKAYVETGRRKIIGLGREVTAQRKDGSTFPIHLAVSEFEVGGQNYFTGIITDLTERKAAEAALRETERQLAQAQKMEAVGQLTGGVAHDFNNLLTIIAGNLELLDMRLEDPVERDLVRRADEAARMGARLTERLLTFSRRRALQPTVVNLNDTTVGMTELLRRSLGENISVTSELAPGLWNARVDASEIENAILNLAINARDAMPDGGRILIETSNVSLSANDLSHSTDAQPGEYVKLTVSDTGVGMSPDVVARAFEPFFTTKESGKGTGLGLSTIYGFVKQSGGHASIYSELGKGTAVSLYLPRDTSMEATTAIDAGQEAMRRSAGETVLVVEDNEQVRDTTIRRLQALGYLIVVAKTGVEAIELLQTTSDIDLVFSDIVMPGGVSGFDIAEWVAANRPAIRVLLTSGFAPEMARTTSSKAAEARLLRKPYKQEDLARAVREVLQGR